MRFAFFGWLLMAMACTWADEPSPAYFEDAQQDSTGTLWAFSRAEYNHIYSFDGSHWTTHPGPFEQPQSAMPESVVRMADGSMACVWKVGQNQIAVTRHVGGDAKISGLTVKPLSDSQNRLWITGEFPQIYRADAKGGAMLDYEIPPDQFDRPLPRQGYNRMEAVEDGLGRVWVWSCRFASNWANLRGVLIFTGDKPSCTTRLQAWRVAIS
jgi:hypothetical protein